MKANTVLFMLALAVGACYFSNVDAKIIFKSTISQLNYIEDDFMPQIVQHFAQFMDFHTDQKLVDILKVYSISMEEVTMKSINYTNEESYFAIDAVTNTTGFLRYHIGDLSMLMDLRMKRSLFHLFVGYANDELLMTKAQVTLDLKFHQPPGKNWVETTVQNVIFKSGPTTWVTNSTFISVFYNKITKNLKKYFDTSFAAILQEKLTDYINMNGGSFIVPWRADNTTLNLTLISVPEVNPQNQSFVMVFNGTCGSVDPNLKVVSASAPEPADVVDFVAGTTGFSQVYASHQTILTCTSVSMLSPQPDVKFNSTFNDLYSQLSSSPFTNFTYGARMSNFGYFTGFTDLSLSNSSWDLSTVYITSVIAVEEPGSTTQVELMIVDFTTNLKMRMIANNYVVTLSGVDFSNTKAVITYLNPKFHIDQPAMINSWAQNYLTGGFTSAMVEGSTNLIPRMPRVSTIDMWTPNNLHNWAMFRFQ